MSDINAITLREIKLISQFIALLQKEQDCLKLAEPTALSDISSAKAPLIDQLNQLESARCAALGISAQEDTRTAMTRWLTTPPQSSDATVNWENLLNLAKEAKHLTETNARLVALHLQQTSKALAILTRQPEPRTLYGSNGQATALSGSRIVDSA